MIGDRKIFAAVLTLCALVGPLIGLVAAIGAECAVIHGATSLGWLKLQAQSLFYVGELALDEPFLSERRSGFLRNILRAVPFAYAAGGVQALVGGAVLGSQLSRSPRRPSVSWSLMAGFLFALLFWAGALAPREPMSADSLLLLVISIVVHVAAAVGCWAFATALFLPRQTSAAP